MEDGVLSLAERTVAEALTAIRDGDRAPASRLLPMVYDLLRERAEGLMGRERADHTLTPTALVHEAYLRVAERAGGFDGRRHFYNAAAQAMRRILVEHARARRSAKRGGGVAPLGLESLDAQHPVTLDAIDWLALDEAMQSLAARDERRHQVVMLRFFAGLTDAEAARVLGVDERTVRRDWVTAKVYLLAQLSDRGGGN